MKNATKDFIPYSQRIPGSVYLWTATVIFAASSALTRKINIIGDANLIDGRNPISLCNVLFVGNLCALIVMGCLFSRDWQRPQLQRLRQRDWISLILIGVLAGALAPALIFAALDRTNVTNVVILSRLQPPLTLVLSFFLLGTRINRYTCFGAIASFIGIAITAVLSQPAGSALFQLGQGELFVAIAAIILSIADILSAIYLNSVSLGLFTVIRTGVGTIVFFILANFLYGFHHFIDVFSPLLWKWMIVYGLLIVVIGQLCWFTGQKRTTSAEITFAHALQPFMAILMAFLILNEVPMMMQWLGGAVLLLGIGLSAIGSLQAVQTSQSLPIPTQASNPIASSIADSTDFRGI
jgi:drug/metabolite transporter (DMT)-like permease